MNFKNSNLAVCDFELVLHGFQEIIHKKVKIFLHYNKSSIASVNPRKCAVSIPYNAYV